MYSDRLEGIFNCDAPSTVYVSGPDTNDNLVTFGFQTLSYEETSCGDGCRERLLTNGVTTSLKAKQDQGKVTELSIADKGPIRNMNVIAADLKVQVQCNGFMGKAIFENFQN